MSTRSLTFVYDEDTPLVCLYRQMDGYPSGMGQDLFDFLSQFRMVNGLGINLQKDSKIANGAGCLAAQLVAHFKTEPGGFYLYPTDGADAWQDYEYRIYVAESGDIRVSVQDCDADAEVFDGTLHSFGKWLKSIEG